jgi:hypothetical protein
MPRRELFDHDGAARSTRKSGPTGSCSKLALPADLVRPPRRLDPPDATPFLVVHGRGQSLPLVLLVS